MAFKVGDEVRLTGDGWEGEVVGSVQTIARIDPDTGYSLFRTPGGDDWDVFDEADGFDDVYQREYAARLVTPAEADVASFGVQVQEVLDRVNRLLLEKNESYGNAALDPVRTFSKASASEQLRVRIDDKLSRLQRGSSFADEDTILDLMGYLVLLRIAEGGQA